MIADDVLTDESGLALNIRLARFLRQEFRVIASGGWPRNPPPILRFLESAAVPGAPRSRLATIMVDVQARTGGPISLGIVDLAVPADANTGTFSIAGWGLDDQSTVGSTSKIWGMYAAFVLRQDVRAFVAANLGVTQSDITQRLQASWRNSPIPELKKVATSGSMPRLEHIFDLGSLPVHASVASNSGSALPIIEFAGMSDCGIARGFAASPATATLAAALETFHQHEYSGKRADKIHMWEQLAAMPFAHRLWLSAAWSDNAAATTCLKDLGISYIDAVMTGSRLYDPAANVGARAALTYGRGPDKLLEEGAWPASSAARRRITEFTEASAGASPRHGASVRTLLCFVTALAHGLVISAADSEQILSLMRPPLWATGALGRRVRTIGLDGNPLLDDDGDPEYVDGVGSFVLEAFYELVKDATVGLSVANAYRPFADAVAKLGIAEGKLADVAIVDIPTTDGRRLYWAVAFLKNRDPGKDERFNVEPNQYGRALREIVRQWLAP